MAEEEISIDHQLSLQILLSNRIVKSAKEAESSKSECTDLSLLITQLIELLVSLARLTTTIPAATFYDRPIRRVTFDLSKTLPRAFTLARRCKHRKSAKNVLRNMFSISTSADVEKVSNLVRTSIADLKWLITVYDFSSGSFNISLPPMACNDPILAWVWSYIVVLHMGSMKERTDAAQELAAIALINDRNKKLIVEENGIGPLLKLLKESVTCEAQIAAATALFNLGNSPDRVRLIANDSQGISIIVKLLFEMPPTSVLVALVNLVWRMADFDYLVKEEFGRGNVVRPLVTLLGMDVVSDEVKKEVPKRTTSVHSVVLMNRQVTRNVSDSVYGNSKSLNYGNRWEKEKEREREVESPEVKLKLKASCAMALWKLVKGSLLNGKKIMETKGLFVLAKIIEKEKGELQINCLMTVMELAAVAEYNVDLKRSAFKPNSPVAKAVLDQLLRVINEDKDPNLLIPAIRAIGCLAKTFPAREARIIEPLVALLGNGNGDVLREVAIALGKFVCPDNFNCVEHSKAVVEFNGLVKLVSLLKRENTTGSQLHVLLLLCYLAIHVGDSQAFEQAQALSVLDGDARHTLAQYPDLCDLFAKARQHLILYQAGPVNMIRV